MSILLNDEDKKVCESISKGEDSIHKKRAIALLSIDEGSTQVKAASDSTLSVGQVRYFLNKYKNIGISSFPADLIDKPAKQIDEIKQEPIELIKKDAPKDIEEKKPKKVVKKKKKKDKKEDKKPKEKISKKKKTKDKDKKKDTKEKNKAKKKTKKKDKK